MKNIDKFLRKLLASERLKVETAIEHILIGQIENLNVKKLTDEKDSYRVRVGRIRIIYKKYPTGNEIVKVDWRDDQTYRGF